MCSRAASAGAWKLPFTGHRSEFPAARRTFSGIDPIQVIELQRIILDLKNAGLGILVTDHNVRETLDRYRPRLHHQ